MNESWTYAWSGIIDFPSGQWERKLPIPFNSGSLAIKVESAASDYRPLLYLIQSIRLTNLGQSIGDRAPCWKGLQIVHFPYFKPFHLIASRSKYLRSATPIVLSVWEPTMPLLYSMPNGQQSSSAVSSEVQADKDNAATILAANPDRVGATIWNNSTARLYLDFDGSASSNGYAVRIDPGMGYELPFGYTGQISGIWSANNGYAFVREFLR